MVIDTSAILAWLKYEPERERITTALENHPVRLVSAVSLFEASIVIRARENLALVEELGRFLKEIEAIVMPFDEQQAKIADQAFQRYGKGQGHPARLNLGDCAAYALAKMWDEPLLFVGNDFLHTDIKPANLI